MYLMRTSHSLNEPAGGTQEHLGGLASWTPPAAGMFLWLRLHGIPCADAILDRLQAEKVVVVPGASCPV